MKKHFSWDLGCCFVFLVLPHTYTFLKKSVHNFLSEIYISESTPPTVTNRASQYGAPSYVGRGGNLSACHVTAWQGVRWSCRTAAEALAAVRQLRRGSIAELRLGSFGGGSLAAIRQLSSGSTIPFSSMSRFSMDFRESRPKSLSPNSSQP